MRGLAEGCLKTRMPQEHNRLYNGYNTTMAKKHSGLRHERRKVPLVAVSAGTVKRCGKMEGEHGQEVDEEESVRTDVDK